MCCSEEFYSTFQLYTVKQAITMHDGSIAYGVGNGNAIWKNSSLVDVELQNVMFVPEFKQNFASVKKIDNGCQVTFCESGLTIKLDGETVATGHTDNANPGALFVLDGKTLVQKAFANSVQSVNQVGVWHRRLEHVTQNKIIQISDGLADDLKLNSVILVSLENNRKVHCPRRQLGARLLWN